METIYLFFPSYIDRAERAKICTSIIVFNEDISSVTAIDENEEETYFERGEKFLDEKPK